MSTPKKNTGLRRIVLAGGYSLKGLAAAWRHEAAFRQEVVVSIILVPVALLLEVSMVERLLLLGALVQVLLVELLNSAIEAVVDRIGYERHELSGRAKDLGSAAVFVSLVFGAIVWAAILGTSICR
ncbi:MAG: diacylglycerol kinase [Desulfuromonas sp.]